MRRLTFASALALTFSMLHAAAGGAAPRLVVRGWPGVQREAAILFAPALRAPGDTLALVGALGAVTARLQGEGWLEARASARWSDAPEAVLSAEVMPGTRWRWGALSLDVPREDSAAVAAAFAWREGGFVDPALVAEAIAHAVARADAEGYAWASLGVSEWRPDSGVVRVRISGARGPRVIVNEVRLDGLAITQPARAEKAMGRLKGLPYNPATARVATQRLEELGVFRRVEYLGLAGAGDWHQGVLRWRVEEPRSNTFEGAVGVQGGGTAVGLARLELGNLLGSARAMALSWQSRGKGLTDFNARYTEPLAFGSPLRLEAALRQQIQDTLYSRFTWGAHARAAIGARERLEAGFEEERVAQSVGEIQSADLGNTTFGIERDDRDDALQPRRGSRARLTATQVFKRERLRVGAGAPAESRTARASAAEVDAEWHRPLGAARGLTLETRAAGRFSSQRVLADFERYPLGGATTLRGHDEDEFRVDRYLLTRLEWRMFLGTGGERVALFWDHAEMATRLAQAAGGDELARRSADGVGFGLRLPAAGGAVDLDYGLQPGRAFLEGKIHLRLVTAF